LAAIVSDLFAPLILHENLSEKCLELVDEVYDPVGTRASFLQEEIGMLKHWWTKRIEVNGNYEKY
jgi:hypothetical protein